MCNNYLSTVGVLDLRISISNNNKAEAAGYRVSRKRHNRFALILG